MSLRHAVRCGITVAMHTDVAILHAAAVTEFLGHVQRSNNQREEAMELWQSVVEVVHFPPPPGNVLEAPGFRPMLQIGCADPECRRCLKKRGGFRFPWLGVWTRPGTLVRTGLFERTHGVITAKAKGRWTCSWSRPMLRDIVPPQWRQVMAALGSREWRNWQVGHECWMVLPAQYRVNSLDSLSSLMKVFPSHSCTSGYHGCLLIKSFLMTTCDWMTVFDIARTRIGTP